jgi:hypothetical protein
MTGLLVASWAFLAVLVAWRPSQDRSMRRFRGAAACLLMIPTLGVMAAVCFLFALVMSAGPVSAPSPPSHLWITCCFVTVAGVMWLAATVGLARIASRRPRHAEDQGEDHVRA